MSFPPPSNRFPPASNYTMMPPPQLGNFCAQVPIGVPINARPQLRTPLLHNPIQHNYQLLKPIDNQNVPKSTVFVGNISKYSTDATIREILMLFGTFRWNRASGASENLQSFGFCEYLEPKCSIRAIKILNGFKIVDKKLLVKMDQKTKDIIEEFQREEIEKGNKDYLKYEQTDEVILQRVKSILHKYKSAIEELVKKDGLDPKTIGTIKCSKSGDGNKS